MLPNMYYYNYLSPSYKQINATNDKTIEVVGYGEIVAEPDIAIVDMGILTENASAKVAQDENSVITNNVIDGLQSIGISEENIRTKKYTINPRYDYINGVQTFRGYEVRHILEITVDNLDMVGNVLETSVKNGINYQQDITFTLSNPDEYYNQALELAVDNAIQKAENIAYSIGGNIIPYPIKISENTQRNITTPFESFMAKDASVPIHPDRVKISASIDALFRYIDSYPMYE